MAASTPHESRHPQGEHHGSKWQQVSVLCPPEAVEAVSALLMAVVPSGVHIEQAGDEAQVSVYIAHHDDPAAALARIEDSLKRVDASLTGGRQLTVTTRWRDEQQWLQAWKKEYRCFRVGHRLVIKPGWEGWPPRDGHLVPRKDDVLIDMDPGLAFGTGRHATTRLCLEAIEQLIRPGDNVADIGCGSGILSIAAAKLGAGRVLAVDADPLAVEVAARNCLRNAVNDKVVVLHADGLPAQAGDFAVIVANINASIVSALTADIAAHLAAGGHCVLSGFTAQQAGEVRRALDAATLLETEALEAEGWLAIIAGRGNGR